MAVAPLELPAYEGDVGGVLPIVAARELEALKQRFPDLEPVEEGKARINKVAGYSLVVPRRAASRASTAGSCCSRSPAPGARDGVKLLLLATPGRAAPTRPATSARAAR